MNPLIFISILFVNLQFVSSIDDMDVIYLNVGGRLITTIRSTLTCMPQSVLTLMFNNQLEEKLNLDEQGNVFLDFNPILFEYLLEQLRMFENNQTKMRIYPPTIPSLIKPFEKMLRKLNINYTQNENKILHVNVGGENMTIRNMIMNQLPNLTNEFFIDSNPENIRQLIKELRNNSVPIPIIETTTAAFSLPPPPPRSLNDYQDGICSNATWDTEGITVAGGHGQGSHIYQLDHPMGIFVDANSSIYVADTYNHRIVKWAMGASHGEIIVYNNETQNFVSKVVMNNDNGTMYYCDRCNNRVERWFNHESETILSNISCWGLALDRNGSLYISIQEEHQILRYPNRQIIAGGHGEGNDDNQLSSPYQIFVDHNQTVYIADYFNHRIVKWCEDSENGVLVAGGHGYGDSLEQMKLPHSIVVDQMGTMYIVDFGNDRILRWFTNSTVGSIIIANQNIENKSNRLSDPYDIAFDREGNLYLADTSNHRVQMYRIDKSACLGS